MWWLMTNRLGDEDRPAADLARVEVVQRVERLVEGYWTVCRVTFPAWARTISSARSL